MRLTRVLCLMAPVPPQAALAAGERPVTAVHVPLQWVDWFWGFRTDDRASSEFRIGNPLSAVLTMARSIHQQCAIIGKSRHHARINGGSFGSRLSIQQTMHAMGVPVGPLGLPVVPLRLTVGPLGKPVETLGRTKKLM